MLKTEATRQPSKLSCDQ